MSLGTPIPPDEFPTGGTNTRGCHHDPMVAPTLTNVSAAMVSPWGISTYIARYVVACA